MDGRDATSRCHGSAGEGSGNGSWDLGLTMVELINEPMRRYLVAVKVIDVFRSNAMTLVPVNVG